MPLIVALLKATLLTTRSPTRSPSLRNSFRTFSSSAIMWSILSSAEPRACPISDSSLSVTSLPGSFAMRGGGRRFCGAYSSGPTCFVIDRPPWVNCLAVDCRMRLRPNWGLPKADNRVPAPLLSTSGSVLLPSPADQTQYTKPGGKERKRARKWHRTNVRRKFRYDKISLSEGPPLIPGKRTIILTSNSLEPITANLVERDQRSQQRFANGRVSGSRPLSSK
jgi:hypothetical protein